MRCKLALFLLLLFSNTINCVAELLPLEMPSQIRREIGLRYDSFIDAGESVIIIGRISPETAKAFLKLASKNTLRSVIVDSGGGDLASALLIANKMRELQLDIYVNGRCFSACVNFLLSAGKKKYVLSNSLIGIHEKTVFLPDNNHTRRLSEVSFNGKYSKNSPYWTDISELLELESAYYKEVQLDTRLLSEYRNFAQSRELSKWGFKETVCKNTLLWILNKNQLNALGIYELEQFWYPQNDIQKAALAKEFGMDTTQLFYGDITQLQRQCETAFTNMPLVNRLFALPSFKFKQ